MVSKHGGQFGIPEAVARCRQSLHSSSRSRSPTDRRWRRRSATKPPKGLAITQVVPDPNSRSTPLIREVQEAFDKFGPKDVTLNHTFIEGYVGAKILGEDCAAPARTEPAETARHARTTQDYDVGGQYVGFSAGNHVGMSYVDITILNKEGKLLR